MILPKGRNRIAPRYEEGTALLTEVKDYTEREKKAFRNFWAINIIKTFLYGGNVAPFMRKSLKNFLSVPKHNSLLLICVPNLFTSTFSLKLSRTKHHSRSRAKAFESCCVCSKKQVKLSY